MSYTPVIDLDALNNTPITPSEINALQAQALVVKYLELTNARSSMEITNALGQLLITSATTLRSHAGPEMFENAIHQVVTQARSSHSAINTLSRVQ